jgi:hypothetical protein
MNEYRDRAGARHRLGDLLRDHAGFSNAENYYLTAAFMQKPYGQFHARTIQPIGRAFDRRSLKPKHCDNFFEVCFHRKKFE